MGALLAMLSPGFAFVVLLVSQAVLIRTLLQKQVMRSFLVSFAIGLLIIPLLELSTSGGSFLDFAGYVLLSAATYAGIAFCYLSLLGMGISLRVRLLYYLYTQERAVTPEELRSGFKVDQLQAIRVQRALDSRSIIRRDGKLYTGSSKTVLFLSRINVFLKRLLTGKRSEFENNASTE